ncbi:MAG: trypsin-like peptidase domain-containing protein [bacterium]
MEDQKSLKKFLLLALVISLLVGGLAGFSAGLGSSLLLSDYISPWLVKQGINLPVAKPQPQTEENSPVGGQVGQPAGDTVVNAVRKVKPAVVSIVVTKDLSQYQGATSPFGDFFGFNLPQIQLPQGEQQIGGGTGFIISADGLILTNKHVVIDSEAKYTVVANDEQKYEAKILATDPFNDIGILKIEANGLPIVTLGDSDKLEVGQTVIAIGNSLGEYQNTVTQGIISAIGRRVTAGNNLGSSEVLEEVIQTDAAINPGNSGGPLINLAGEVIGVNTAISQAGQSIGFAIPINQAKKTAESVKKYGRIIRPYLGIRYVPITPALAEKNKLNVDYGALIVRGQNAGELAIVPGSPADKAGLEENDIILEINGQKIDSGRSLAKEIAKFNPGDKIKLKILHDGGEKEVEAVLEEYKE